jgi:ferredoxin-nitrite reductase
MEALKNILLSEIDEFNKVGHKFVSGEISRGDFKGFSGGMGVYAHRSGTEFMVRLRISSGVLSKDEFKKVYALTDKYNLGGIHLTTRQAIQLHGLNIDELCSVMREGLENDIYTRGSGGNFPRNISISPLAGIDPEEAFDVTPYALAAGRHILSKITTYKLPRKLKISFSGSSTDLGHVTIADQGFLAVKKGRKNYFKVYIGGGLGRNPQLGVELDELIEPKELLYHVEAITNLFIAEGDYTNKAKARIRYILERMGRDEFINCYKKHLSEVKEKATLELKLKRIRYEKEGLETTLKHPRLFAQKQTGLYSVYFHPIGGQLTLETFKLLLDQIETIKKVDIRLSMSEGLYIRNLNGNEAEKLITLTEGLGGETSIETSTACIGVPTCQMGASESQTLLTEIVAFFREKGDYGNVLPPVHISGCTNSCAVHQISTLGFCGKMKKVENTTKAVFEFHLGGALGIDKTRLGNNQGDMLQEKVPEFLYELCQIVSKSNLTFEQWINDNLDEMKKLILKYTV